MSVRQIRFNKVEHPPMMAFLYLLNLAQQLARFEAFNHVSNLKFTRVCQARPPIPKLCIFRFILCIFRFGAELRPLHRMQ
jgi:hypothetical protein